MSYALPSVSRLEDRQIRVFISSTFRDMHAERELLVKVVFPELRRLCDERFVSFTEVDLRWGITEEQAAEGKVLPICLEEIATCRPYFIGLLGERYGWIPCNVPPDVLVSEPWIQEHISNRTSVTELEILHGVLKNPQMAGHAFFYFRDPAYIASLPETEQRGMVERDIPDDLRDLGPEEAARRTRQRIARLAALKETIRQSGMPLVEPYADPAALAAAVRSQFIELIDRLYPKEQVPDPLNQEAIGHRTHARRKLLAYVDRPVHSRALTTFAEAASTGRGLVVTGESGGGKTALLADFVSSAFKAHPSTFLFEHYFGATPGSTSVDGFLRRLLGELKRLATIKDEIPATSEKMREALPLWLAQSVGGRPLVLVLDGLNQIQGDEADRRLLWLPRAFPPHVRVIASCLPGQALDTLLHQGWAEHHLPLIDAGERGRMLDAFLREYRKELGANLRRQIIEAPGSANPLFLRTVLEELRQFGDFDRLPETVRDYLGATHPGELFRRVIHRWRTDFHAGRDLVDRSLRHLWAARQGLSDTEWLDLLADAQGPMDRQTWRPLLLAMEPHLVQRGSLWALGHDFLREAVTAELVPTDTARQQAHLTLADYFEQQATGPRQAEELPWQLREAGDRERLNRHLLEIPLFRLLHARDPNELMGYWVWLKQERTMGPPYLQAFDRWAAGKGESKEVAYAANQLGYFLSAAALFTDSETLMRSALRIDEQSYGLDHPSVAIRLNNLAFVLQATNRLAEAEPLMRRALKIDEQSNGLDHPDVARDLNNLASLLKITGRLVDAEPLMRRALRIFESSLGSEHPDIATVLINLASLLQAANRLTDAEPLMRRALSIDEQSLGLDHPNVARHLSSLAALLLATNRLAEAEPLFRRALRIFESGLGSNHPDVARVLNNLASLLQAANRLAEAEPLMRRALSIDEQSLGLDHREVAGDLCLLAQLLQATNRLAEAEPLLRRALEIDERSFGLDHPDVARVLNNLASLLQATNRLAEAEPLMRRALSIDEQSFGLHHPTVAIDLNDLAQLLQATNRLAEAEPLMRRALAIDERSYGPDHPNVARNLNSLAWMLQATNRLAEAEPLMRRALSIDEQSFGLHHPTVAIDLNDLAQLLQDTNCIAEAEPLMRRALAIDERSFGLDHPNVARDLNNLGQLLQAVSRLAEAEPLMRRALAIDERSYGPDHPNVAIDLNNLARLLKATNRLVEAEPPMRRHVQIFLNFTRTTGHPHPHLNAAFNNYAGLLMAMGQSREHVIATLRQLAPELFSQEGS